MFDKDNRVNIIIGSTGCGKSTLARKVIEGSTRLICFDLLGDYDCEPVTKCSEILEIIRDRPEFRLSFRPVSTAALVESFNYVCRLCKEYGNITLLIEEFSLYTEKLDSNFYDLLLMGRHWKVNLVIITQQTDERCLPKKVVREAHNFYAFRFDEPYALYYLKNYVDVEVIKSLPQYTFINLKRKVNL